MNLDDSQNIFDNGIQYGDVDFSAYELRQLLLKCEDNICRDTIEEIITNYEDRRYSLNEAILRITSTFLK